MKILLSAYACEPGRGSEPEVGWRWALELARSGHQVWVLTRENNRLLIEKALSHGEWSNLHFLYYDLPGWARWWKRGPRGVYLYYLLWQAGAYRFARQWAGKIPFDLVHHITLGVFRHPSFMVFLNVPFVFGPVGGGEKAPQALRKSFPLRGRLKDSIRDIANRLALFDPFTQATFNRAAAILCRTRETMSCLPGKVHSKCRLSPEIGADISGLESCIESAKGEGHSEFRILYVGRLLCWKGVHLGLNAFAELLRRVPSCRLTIVGSGPEEVWLKKLAVDLGIGEYVDWVAWLPRAEVMNYYRQHDVFLFPSLHDSGGTVVLEALSHGLPVVCLDLGGPGSIVNDDCGRVVRTADCSEREVFSGLALQLERLALDPDLRGHCSAGALIRARHFQWSAVVSRAYDEIGKSLGKM